MTNSGRGLNPPPASHVADIAQWKAREAPETKAELRQMLGMSPVLGPLLFVQIWPHAKAAKVSLDGSARCVTFA